MNWQAKLISTAFLTSQFPQLTAPEVAFVGRSNVGKSSLINKLINQKLAHVSSKPGKTRSVNFFDVTGPVKFTLVDLPGFGYAGRSKSEKEGWAKLVSDYLTMRENLRLIVHLVDLRHGLVGVDRVYQEWSKSLHAPTMVFFTKADKIAVTKRKPTAFEYVKKGLISWDVPLVCSIQDAASIERAREFIKLFLESKRNGEG